MRGGRPCWPWSHRPWSHMVDHHWYIGGCRWMNITEAQACTITLKNLALLHFYTLNLKWIQFKWITHLNGYHFFWSPLDTIWHINMDKWILCLSGYHLPGPSAIHLSGFDCTDNSGRRPSLRMLCQGVCCVQCNVHTLIISVRRRHEWWSTAFLTRILITKEAVGTLGYDCCYQRCDGHASVWLVSSKNFNSINF